MIDVLRVKKTRQIVYEMGAAGQNHTLCLFPYDFVTRKGNQGVIQPVRNDNLVKDKEVL